MRAALPLVLAVVVACGPRPAPAPPGPPAVADDAGDDTGAPPADRDGDGVVDADDRCPDQAMVMSAGCAAAAQTGCPDDCRPSTIIVP